MNRIIHFARYLCAGMLLVATGHAGAAAGAIATQLAPLGWEVVDEADGSVRLTPPAPGTAGTGAPDASPVLTIRGWRIAQEADGSLLLIPPAIAPSPAAETTPSPAQTLLDPDAAARLEELGWRVERAEDGSLLLFPPFPAPEDEYPVPPNDENLSTPAPTRDFSILDEASIAALMAQGWYVERAPDGSLLLYPPELESVPEPLPEPLPQPPDAAAETSRLIAWDDDTILEALEERGWQVERAPDGSLLLFPADYEQVPAEALPGGCAGYAPTALAVGSVDLPVDTWDEAHAIASDWIAATQKSGLAVGRIRQLFRVHLVSIVEAEAPRRLLHQIAVRNADGTVVLLD